MGEAWDAAHMPDWVRLSGLLPPGALGLTAWQKEADAIQCALQGVADSPWLDTDSVATVLQETVDVQIAVDDQTCRITGQVSQVYAMADNPQGRVLLRMYP
ncbi:MAG: hypothetical protein ACO24Z_06665, partial [Arenimonas sp.]